MNKNKEEKSRIETFGAVGCIVCDKITRRLCKYAKENEPRADCTANTITLIIPISPWTRIPENSHLMGF